MRERKPKKVYQFMCVYCGRVYKKEDISTPMKDYPGWVWMLDSCPVCGKGCDDWYSSCRGIDDDPVFLLKAIRVQRNVKRCHRCMN